MGNDVLKIINRDILYECEENGISGTASLPLFMAFNQMKGRILKDHNDTYFRISFDDAIQIAMTQLNFNVIYHTHFTKDGVDQQQVILWDGFCILNMTSYSYKNGEEKHLNSANMYFNWAKTKINDYHPHYSGSTDANFLWDNTNKKVIPVSKEYHHDTKTDLIRGRNYTFAEQLALTEDFHKKERQWRKANNLFFISYGDIDIREAFVANFNAMKENGVFISPWVNIDHLNLRHYGEEHLIASDNDFCENYFIHKLNKLDKLPPEVVFKLIYYY